MDILLNLKLEEYLKVDSDYIFFISGKPGIGKSFYFKNTAIPKIKKIENQKSSANFTPIHISLFGINSISDLEKRILNSLMPYIDQGFSFVGNMVNLLSIGKINFESEKKSNRLKKKLINFSDLVLCFDDIDRRGTELKPKELFGYLNNLTENEGAKIIVIADENTLLEDDEYLKIKEKVIGITVDFIPDTSSVFEALIEKFRSHNIDYFHFLLKNKDLILDKIKIAENNLRFLKYFIEHFELIFAKLNSYFIKNNESIHVEEKFKAVLEFSFPIAIEYKSGRLNSKNFETILVLYKSPVFDLKSFLSEGSNSKNEPELKENLYMKEFKSKYLKSYQKRYFESVLDHFLGLDEFDLNVLIEELNKYFIFSSKSKTQHDEVLLKLKYWTCIDHSFSEMKKLTKEMIRYAKIGKYDIREFTEIFHNATRFDNFLNLNIDEFKSDMKKWIQIKARKLNSLNRIRSDFHISKGMEYYCELCEIDQFIAEKIREIRLREQLSRAKQLYSLFKNSFDTFIETQGNSIFPSEIAVWNLFSPSKFFNDILMLKNSQIIDLKFYFKNRYSSINSDIENEYEFIQELKQRISNYITSKKQQSTKIIALRLMLRELEATHFPQKSIINA